jgi:tRNA G18 (ribose-2'-O)-methylase SpoU
VARIVEAGDVGDPRLDDYRHLNQPARRRALERSGNFFVAEGELVIRTLLGERHTGRWPVRSVLVTPQRYDAMADVLGPLAADDVPVYLAPLDVLRAVSGFDVHRGALATAERGTPRRLPEVLHQARTVLVLEAVSDHENLGALFRNAAALGADAVVLGPRTGDPLYRRSLRVSMGHVLRVPFARLHVLDDLKAAGHRTVALTPSHDAEPIASFAARAYQEDKVALLLGAEGPGLSDDWLAQADDRVRIPMAAGVDSLNVAVAAAVALYELGLRRLEDVGELARRLGEAASQDAEGDARRGFTSGQHRGGERVAFKPVP